MQTFALAEHEQVPVQFQTTVSHDNVYHTPRVLHHVSNKTEADVIFRQATVIERLDNRETLTKVDLDDRRRSFFADFLRSDALRRFTHNPARRLFYGDLAHRTITGDPRRAPCYFQREGVVLDQHGNLYHCSISTEPIGNAREQSAEKLYFSKQSEAIRDRLLKEVCPGCMHDQSGAWSPARLIAETLRETSIGQKAQKAARVVEFGADWCASQVRRY